MLFGLALIPVAIGLGIATDSTRLLLSGVHLQDGADVAALATVIKRARDATLTDGALAAIAQQNAQSAFNQNGAEHPGVVAVAVTSRDPIAVKVTLSQDEDLIFGGMLGMGPVKVVRVAEARSALPVPVCLLQLNPNAANAWTNQGTTNVIAPTCAAQVNSSSAQALQTGGGGSVQTLRTLVVASTQNAPGFTPVPRFGQAALADPLAGKITWPTSGSCTASNLSFKNTTAILAPGTYCGGLSLQSGATVTLLPGTYVIPSGGLFLTAGATLLAPVGSTIVLTGDDTTINVQSGGALTITAPSSGPWTGIAIAQKPQSVERTSTLIGGGETDIAGTIYLPTQQLALTGGGVLTRPNVPRIFVAGRFALNGNGRVYASGNLDVISTDAKAYLTK